MSETEKVEASLEGVVTKKRRGRKPKVRHDAIAVATDGYGDRLAIENQRKGFKYCWVNSRDLQRYKRFGAEELREGDKDRPIEWCGDRKEKEVVRYNELTAVRIPETAAAQMDERDWMRRQHSQLMGQLVKQAKSGESTFEVRTWSPGSGDIQIPT